MNTKRGAQNFERQLLNELAEDEAAGRHPLVGSPPLFEQFVERWMNEYVTPQHRPSTVRKERSCIRTHLLPKFGSTRIDDITTRQVDELIADMRAKGRAPKTIHNTLSILHTCLDRARQWQLLRTVPNFSWPSLPAPETRWLTEEEERALLDACDPGFWQTLVLFYLHTGLRFTEGAVLTWKDVDLESASPVVHVRKGGAEGKPGPTKSGSHRDVPLDRVILAALMDLPRTSDRIFPSPTDKQMNPASKTKYLYKFCDRAGIPRCGWHPLRHTYATRLAADGTALPVIMKLMGHTSIKTTMRYVHVDQRTMNATAAVLERVMAAPRGTNCHLIATKPVPPDETSALAS